MVAVPSEPAVTEPVTGSMLATAALVLLHVPPVTASLNVLVPPVHKSGDPRIAVGVALMVIGAVT